MDYYSFGTSWSSVYKRRQMCGNIIWRKWWWACTLHQWFAHTSICRSNGKKGKQGHRSRTVKYSCWTNTFKNWWQGCKKQGKRKYIKDFGRKILYIWERFCYSWAWNSTCRKIKKCRIWQFIYSGTWTWWQSVFICRSRGNI